ncbi:MAG: sugar transferase [Clostridia bacterium]|nr:sugar transferase [Clostridia bacterium]
MYKRKQTGWLKHLDFIILDLICLGISYLWAYLLRHGSVASLFANKVYVSTGLMLLVFDLLVIVLFGTMHDVLRRGIFKELTSAIKQDLLVFGFISIYLFSVKDGDQLSRIVLWLTLGLHVLTSFLAFIGWKKAVARHHTGQQRSMLLVADKAMVQGVIDRFKSDTSKDANITGVVIADNLTTGGSWDGIPIVSSLENAPKYICREWIDEVYICTSVPPFELIARCNEMGVTVHRELHSAGGDQQFVEKMAGVHVLTSTMNSATPGQMFLKRAMDILGGIVGSLAALIIMAIVGPKIKKASPGPILFTQERIGQNGKRFKMYKIRSMYMDAEARKAELMKQNRVSDGMMFKLDFDPRIIGNEVLPDGSHKTGIGEFIRNTSLDEFPQFFNVLMGQMSLVGTRPPTVDEWEKYEYHHRARLTIKPGLTGMWQVSGRSGITDFEEVVKLDTEYINNWSLGLDIKILLKTIISVIRRDGAM